MTGFNTALSVNDHPVALLVQRAIAPLVAGGCLLICAVIFGKDFHQGPYLALAIIAVFLAMVVFGAQRKSAWGFSTARRQASSDMFSWLLLSGVLLGIGAITHQLGSFDRALLLLWFLVTPLVIIGFEWLYEALAYRYLLRNREPRKVVIAGMNDLARQLVWRINDDPTLGMSFEGAFDDREPARVGGDKLDKLRGNMSALPEFVNNNDIDVIFITLPMVNQTRILDLLDQLRDTTASIYFVPDIFIFDLIQARVEDIRGVLAVAVCETPFHGVNSIVKRASDILLSGSFLLLASPFLLLIALGVKLSSPGPAIFKQARYGVDGKKIMVYKFRSMFHNAAPLPVVEDSGKVELDVNSNPSVTLTTKQATRGDPRITRFGAFIRKTSLDELPQFINVLQGRMSVVGPRPHAVDHNEMYRKVVKGYMIRHKVKPGITGLAQVNGFRGETETLEKMERRIAYDLDYLRHWSLALDFQIVIKTALMMFTDKSAY